MKNEYSFISNEINAHGGECYLVGGFVRDKLLEYNNQDYDLATSLKPSRIRDIFKDYIIADYAYKYGNIVLSINDIKFEVTTYRTDHNAFKRKCDVEFTDDIVVDSKRRDFTINAIYCDTQNYYDFNHGIEDLNNKIIKTVIDPKISFKQDPLRMLRAIRFVGTYNFEIEQLKYEALVFNFDLLEYVNKNVIYKELSKLIMSPYFIETFNKFQLLFNAMYPEINKEIKDLELSEDYKTRIKQLATYFNITNESQIIINYPQFKKLIK